MTVVTRKFADITKRPDYYQFEFETGLRRSQDDDDVTITPKRIKAVPQTVDGEAVLSVELDPGPARVTYRGVSFIIEIPESGPADLQDLIDAGVVENGTPELPTNSVALRGYSVDDTTVVGTELISFIQGSEVARADLAPLVEFTEGQVETALTAAAPGAVTADIAGRDLDVGLSGSDVQLTLGGAPLGAPLDLNVSVPIANPSAVKTSAYTALANELIPADATAGAFTVTLPSTPANATVVVIKKIDSSANVVTVQRSGSDVFNHTGGPSTVQLTTADQSLWVQYKSGIWYVLGHGTPLAALDTRYYSRNGTIPEPNGNTALSFDAVASAVNYLRVIAAATGGNVVFRAAGTDANVGIEYRSKGNLGHTFRDGAGFNLLALTTLTDPTSYVRLTPGTAAAAALISLLGTDTAQGLNVVASKLTLNGADIATQGVQSQATSSTITLNATLYDSVARTAQNSACTINAPTGTLRDTKEYTYRFKDSGTAKALTWDAAHRVVRSGISLPTTTVAGKTLYVRGKWNAADSKLDILDVTQEP